MYGTKYILPFSNDLDELYEIYFDFLNYTGGQTLLKGSDDTLTIRSTGGDENKMQPLLGTEALINIWVDTTTPLSIDDLVAAHDNDIRVTVYREKNYTTPVFQGFIVVEDNSQPFRDKPFILNVRALDGLGLLKGVDLVDTNGLLFAGIQSIVSWIAQILYKTDQTLPLRVYFNLYEKSFKQNIGALEQIYLSSVTFSRGDAFNAAQTDPSIDEAALAADDCYTALEKIVRCLRCRLFQENGRWNLVSLYEYLNPAGFSFTEYTLGVPSNGLVPAAATDTGIDQDYSLSIGADGIVFPIGDDQNIYLKIATKWIKLTYNYDQSQNKIINQDLSDISPDIRLPTFDMSINSNNVDPAGSINNGVVISMLTQAYQAFGFTLQAINIGLPVAPDGSGFVRQILDSLGYVYETILVTRQNYADGLGNLNFLTSSAFLVDVGDKLQLAFSYRTLFEVPQNSMRGLPIAICRFTGTDGTIWYLNAQVGATTASWVKAVAGAGVTPIKASDTAPFATTDVWASFDMTGIQALPAVPGSGSVTVSFGMFAEVESLECWYKDIQVTILSYLNGTLNQIKGDYNFNGSNNNIKQTDSETVEISDSPKRYFKGALLDSLSNLLSTSWARAGKVESFRFGQFMGQLVYTHLSRQLKKMEGTWCGLIYRDPADVSKQIPNGYLNSWMFTDSSVPTKRHMLTSFEKVIGTGQWRGVFVETLQDQNDLGLLAPDIYAFNYVFQ